MSVTIETDEKTVTAHLIGELDHHNAKDIRIEIDLAIEKHRPEKLILDFDEVTFMDSSGIGLVMGRYNTVKKVGGTVSVENTSSQIKKVRRQLRD